MSTGEDANGEPGGGARGILTDAAGTLRPPRGGREGPLPPMLLTLTVVTGVVDAVSYLRLGHVFVANMTGNVVFLGFAIAGARGLSAASLLAAIAAFLVGALAGGRLGALTAEHRGYTLRVATGVQAALILIALAMSLALASPTSGAGRYGLLVPLALAMGVQNAAAQRVAVVELTTTVLTRTLTGIASEARLVGGRGSLAGRRLLAVAAMLVGAIVGGLLALHVSVPAALAVATALVVAVALAAHALSQPDAAWRRA